MLEAFETFTLVSVVVTVVGFVYLIISTFEYFERLEEKVDELGYKLDDIDRGTTRILECPEEAELCEYPHEPEDPYSGAIQGRTGGTYSGRISGQAPTPTYPHELERVYTQELRRYYDHRVHDRDEQVAYQDRRDTNSTTADANHFSGANQQLGGYGVGSMAQAATQVGVYHPSVLGTSIAGQQVPFLWTEGNAPVDVEGDPLG